MPVLEDVVMQFENSGGHLTPIAVLLLDRWADRLSIRFREDFDWIAEPTDAEVVEFTLMQLVAQAAAMSGMQILGSLEDTLSNAIRISERSSVAVENSPDMLAQLDAEPRRSVRQSQGSAKPRFLKK